ncbi:MAG: 50S ribosomal protein L4 [Betaproteobacteria bacterium TMED41]|nr:MAG: 50S ribosomal protein L4 [Betaproteobacteria bacterium TMED41]|tara:strand:- start:1589 stop:2209 length:621 start_codon:yes stop_codon:yes gene_type:complete
MNLDHIDKEGKKVATVDVSEYVFNRSYNESLVHQVLVSYQSNARGGNRAQKDRSMVKCSTRKPWKQKGTGRARAGTAASPLWRGGGQHFPSSPEENFTKKINKKMYKAGLRSILSQLAREERIAIVEEINVDEPKTKSFLNLVTNRLSSTTLIVCNSIDNNLKLASRNVPNLFIITPSELDPFTLIRCKKMLISTEALSEIESTFS